MSKLNDGDIRGIVAAHLAGESKLSIAKRLGVHHSTVIHHIRHYEEAYVEQGSVYAVIKAAQRKVCTHPSLHCLLCGKAQDHIHSEEGFLIRSLRTRLKAANETLRMAGLPVQPIDL